MMCVWQFHNWFRTQGRVVDVNFSHSDAMAAPGEANEQHLSALLRPVEQNSSRATIAKQQTYTSELKV
jgi:hypothetical protein